MALASESNPAPLVPSRPRSSPHVVPSCLLGDLYAANDTHARTDYFDSAEYVHRFEQQGLSKQQAEGVVDALEGIVQESMDNLEANLVSRSEHYKVPCDPLSLLCKRVPADFPPARPQHHDRQKVHLISPQSTVRPARP